MFTGLIETIGVVRRKPSGKNSGRLEIAPGKRLDHLKGGDSVAVNGACLTLVEDFDGEGMLKFDVLAETLKRTNLGSMRIGSQVNLERALSVGDRLGGHFVQGHVDATATVTSWGKLGGDKSLTIAFPTELRRYFIPKGSVAIDGVSLTIVDLGDDFLSVRLIPTTLGGTCLADRKTGDRVNLEADMLGKYVVGFLEASAAEKKKSTLSMEDLLGAGW